MNDARKTKALLIEELLQANEELRVEQAMERVRQRQKVREVTPGHGSEAGR